MSVFKLNKLLYKFFIGYLLAIILPTIGLGAVLFYYQTDKQLDGFINNRQMLLLADKSNVENQLANGEAICRSLSTSPVLIHFLEESNTYTTANIIYEYRKNIVPLLESVQAYPSEISNIQIYTFNEQLKNLLIEFRSIDNLEKDLDDIAENFILNGCWDLKYIDGRLYPTYYRTILNTSYSQIIGVVELTCQPQILSSVFSYEKDEADVYIYRETEKKFCIRNQNFSTFTYTDFEKKDLTSSYTGAAILENFLIEKIFYRPLNVSVFFISPLSATGLGLNSISAIMIPISLFFLIMNLVFLPTIFKPLHNISLLTDHIRICEAKNMRPYKGKITKDEIGELISAYNDMVSETDFLREAVQHSEILKKNAQIEALQSQLNPHFFYGTLENIRMIAEAHQEYLIAEIAVSFGRLLRYSLSRNHFVSIQDEIDIVKQYLSIQNKRIGNRFSEDWNIQLSEEEFLCPKFVLYTMVENVFAHCINHTREKITIKIEILQESNDIYIIVKNNGADISAAKVNEIENALRNPQNRTNFQAGHNGRGIFNINDRLRLYYGDNYDFTFHSASGWTECCAHIRKFTEDEKKSFLIREAD